jgi:uncharacterized damage-inducible protein DinB
MSSSSLQRIADQLARVHDGDAWYGPSTFAVLRGVTAEQAAAHPLPGAHSIWEIAFHVAYWQREVLRRLRTGQVTPSPDDEWPAREPDEEAWRSVLAQLRSTHRELLDELAGFPAERLGEVLGEGRDPALGTGVTFHALLHGLLQHNVYHTGQIALLRKAITS